MSIREIDRIDDYGMTWERWIIEKMCGIKFSYYVRDRKLLTSDILNKNVYKIMERLEVLKRTLDNPPKYGERLYSIVEVETAHQMLALLILETGAFLPDHLRDEVFKTTTWEYDNGKWGWHPHLKEIRKFYLNQFREKLKNHELGKSQCFKNLLITSDKDFEFTIIGLEQIYECLRLREQQRIKYINLDCCGLTEVPKEILKFENLEKLNLSNNKLKELPKDLIKLKSLKVVYVHNNQIKSLPENLTDKLIIFGMSDLAQRNSLSLLPRLKMLEKDRTQQ